MYLILLTISMHCRGSLSQLTILVRNEFFLMSKRVTDIRVIVALVLDDFVQEVLVIDF